MPLNIEEKKQVVKELKSEAIKAFELFDKKIDKVKY